MKRRRRHSLRYTSCAVGLSLRWEWERLTKSQWEEQERIAAEEAEELEGMTDEEEERTEVEDADRLEGISDATEVASEPDQMQYGLPEDEDKGDGTKEGEEMVITETEEGVKATHKSKKGGLALPFHLASKAPTTAVSTVSATGSSTPADAPTKDYGTSKSKRSGGSILGPAYDGGFGTVQPGAYRCCSARTDRCDANRVVLTGKVV